MGHSCHMVTMEAHLFYRYLSEDVVIQNSILMCLSGISRGPKEHIMLDSPDNATIEVRWNDINLS